MFGHLIAALDNPEVAAGLLAALDEPSLAQRLALAAEAADREPADYLAATVRDFLDAAPDDQWLQLVGVMSRAQDPGLAAVRAILEKTLPKAGQT